MKQSSLFILTIIISCFLASCEQASIDIPKEESPLQSDSKKFPIAIHRGEIFSAEMSDSEQSMVDLDQMFVEGKFKSTPVFSNKQLISRPPLSGNQYIIITILLKAGRSISNYDYKLQISGIDHKCLSMRYNNPYFDQRMQVIKAEKDGKKVDLLFEVPTLYDEEQVELKQALATTLTDKPVILPLKIVDDF